MKKRWIACLLAACMLLAGCAARTEPSENGGTPAQPDEPSNGDREIAGQDWRTWGTVDGTGTLHIGGTDVDVCACVFGDRVELYLDEPSQNLYKQIDYPKKLSTEQYEKANVQFDDYTGDGNTDVRVIVGDESAPEQWWTWVWDTDDFVYAAALAYPPAMAAADAALGRYLSTIRELHDSGSADRFALVYVDGDDVPELAAVNSEGLWDRDQVFLYTLDGDEPVLLASDIAPGMEGHSIAFDEGDNFILRSGAVTGERLICLAIGANGPEQVLSLEWCQNAPDPDVISYFINGQETDEAQYLAKEGELAASHDTMIRLDIEEMSVISLRLDNWGIMETVVGTIPYQSYEAITGA